MANNFSKETCENIIKLYNSGLSMKKIGEQYNTNAVNIMKILHDNEVEIRTKGGIYSLPEEQIVEMYKQGNTL